MLVSATAQGGGAVALPTPTATASGSPPATPGGESQLYVHVSGAVVSPGLVTLPPGSRVVDAIGAAGGLAEGADAAGVNLARLVQDGEQLRVPAVGEAPAPSEDLSGGASVGGAEGVPIDLNTATAAQLETLPRIGPALAQRILDWRAANGRFAAVTDLMEVAGIGQKVFEGLESRVRV